MKLLIDINLLIDLEYDDQLEAQFASFERSCAKYGLDVFVHETSKRTELPNGNVAARKAISARIEAFRTLPGSAPTPKKELERNYGRCMTEEEVVDATLLDAAALKAADYVVSDSPQLHKRAKAAGLEFLVFTVEDASAWILQNDEPKDVHLPTVSETFADALDFDDMLFDDLRKDYEPGFDEWTAKISSERRSCWIVKVDEHLAALVIRKDETHAEAKTDHPGPRILKISTFKVSKNFRGRKLGEQLVKQILWFAQQNSYDLVYLTAYPKQKSLRMLLEAYGFAVTKTRENGETVLEKVIEKGRLVPRRGETAFAATSRGYPNFVCDHSVSKFVIPIQPPYHAMLFPESRWTAVDRDVEILGLPGNTIEKVFLCHSRITTMQTGDVILFYLSKGVGDPGSQSITTVGVVKSVRRSQDIDEVRLWTAKRSVYPDPELVKMVERTTPLMIIDFLLVGHFSSAVPIDDLTSKGILSSFPQSIVQINDDAFTKLKALIDLGFAF